MFCNKCGTQVNDQMRFCPNCGNPINNKVNDDSENKYGILVEKAKHGDEQSINELIKLTERKLYFVALSYVKKDADAQDVVQNAYIKAFSNLNTLQDNMKFEAWVTRIVSNGAISMMKTASARYDVKFTDLGDSDNNLVFDTADERIDYQPEMAYDAKEKTEILKSIINQLSDEQRIAVMMYFYEQMTTKEIAEELGVSENTVKARIKYAKDKIKTSVVDLEQKHGIKLYNVAPLPFFLLLLRNYSIQGVFGKAFATSISPLLIQSARYVSTPMINATSATVSHAANQAAGAAYRTGTFEGTIYNSSTVGGTTQATGTLSNAGTISGATQATGTVSNAATVGGTTQATGTLSNAGTISGTTQATGTVSNAGTISGATQATGTVSNAATVGGTTQATGTVSNAATVGGTTQATGTVSNAATVGGTTQATGYSAATNTVSTVTGSTQTAGTSAAATSGYVGTASTVADVSATTEAAVTTGAAVSSGTVTLASAATAATIGSTIVKAVIAIGLIGGVAFGAAYYVDYQGIFDIPFIGPTEVDKYVGVWRMEDSSISGFEFDLFDSYGVAAVFDVEEDHQIYVYSVSDSKLDEQPIVSGTWRSDGNTMYISLNDSFFDEYMNGANTFVVTYKPDALHFNINYSILNLDLKFKRTNDYIGFPA